jgi:hypothetical protein
MIDYPTFHRLRQLHDEEHLSVAQIAQALALDERTVGKWVTVEKYQPRQAAKRPSKLDPFKSTIVRLLAQHPYTAQQLLQRLKEGGYTGGYDRHQDFEKPEHVEELLAQRRQARQQQHLTRFLALSPKAGDYYRRLEEKRSNPRHHVQKIVALSEIYGVEKVQRALEDALAYQAFSCEYIANLLEQRERPVTQPGALHLTRQQDLLDLDLPVPDLSLYESQEGDAP